MAWDLEARELIAIRSYSYSAAKQARALEFDFFDFGILYVGGDGYEAVDLHQVRRMHTAAGGITEIETIPTSTMTHFDSMAGPFEGRVVVRRFRIYK